MGWLWRTKSEKIDELRRLCRGCQATIAELEAALQLYEDDCYSWKAKVFDRLDTIMLHLEPYCQCKEIERLKREVFGCKYDRFISEDEL